MSVLALGVSFRRAPVELLEQLSFVEDDYPKAYRILKDMGEVQEAVILSTCNRVEIFAEVGTMLAEEELGGLAGRSAVVVGAGGMASLAVKHLRGREIGQLGVVNRNLDRARRLAAKAGGKPYGLDALVAALAQADLVVSSTGAAGTVIGPDAVGEALARNGRGRRPLFLLDLAVPRDVDPAVKDFPDVRLANIDDLKGILAETGTAPGDLERARAIVLEEVARFAAWRRAARLAPLIQALRERGARIQAAELARASSRLSSLSDREWAAIESLASGIVAKLLHQPIVRLKERSGPGAGDELARAAAELFGLGFDPRA